MIESDPSPASPTSSVPPTCQSDPAPVTFTEAPLAPLCAAITAPSGVGTKPGVVVTVAPASIDRLPRSLSPTVKTPTSVTVPPLLTVIAVAPLPDWPRVRPSVAARLPSMVMTPPTAPPEDTTSKPPLRTVVLLAVPPENTNSAPPLFTVVPVSVPYRNSVPPLISVPPLFTVVKLAVPPEDTYSVLSLLTVVPMADPPE